MLPHLLVLDDVLASDELAKWQDRLRACTEQSTGRSAEEMEGEQLLVLARKIVGDLELIHAPMFAIQAEHITEMHCDIGEYAILFYPLDCPTAPLRYKDGEQEATVAVKANRLVALDVTEVLHQQVLPTDGSVRYSIALKFRRGE